MTRPQTELGGRPARRSCRLLASIALLLFSQLALAQSPMRLVALYPAVSAPYLDVFERILEGMRSVEGVTVIPHELREGASADELRNWLRTQKPDGVVALGQSGLEAASALEPGVPVVAGAALLKPGGLPGISLAADPEQTFAWLANLAPPVKRVFLVYNPDSTGWLLPQARAAAERHNITLFTYEAQDSRASAQTYRRILEEGVRDLQDALWLPLENAAPDASVLPLVLETAWHKRVVVFSHNARHAKKGALFALLPDDFGMGRRLCGLVSELQQNKRPEVQPLRDLKVAVNLRTASHLGLLYSADAQRSFSVVFPGGE